MMIASDVPGIPKAEIILGSASPRRKELLERLGLKFHQVSIDADESFSESMPPFQVAEYLALKKSDHYRDLKDGQLLITADTVVIRGESILNKPADGNEALEMLTLLSGKEHQVITGVVIRTNKQQDAFSVCTSVVFDELSNEVKEFYIQNFKPFDKAGAYGIQEWIGCVGINSISGCYYNVMGLPLNELYKRLCAF